MNKPSVSTERKRPEELLATVFESSPNGMILVDREGKIVFANSQAEKLFGYSRQELLCLTIDRLVPERFRSPHLVYQDSFFAAPTPRPMGAGRDLAGLRKDGTEIPVEIGLSPVETAEGLFTLASLIDITERKKMEEKIKRLLQIKTDFTNMVSHELRTPLVAIRESNNIVCEGAAGPVNAEQKSYLEMVKRNVERLSRLIDGILDFSQLETGKKELRMAEGDINDLIAEVVRFQKPVASQKGLGLTCELDSKIPKIKFDPDSISQVLTNLISNAVKFTEKGEITIRSRLEADQIRVSVRDTGVGIAPGDAERLFQPFEQITGRGGQRPEGTGLGLAICKEIVEHHQGKIGIESEVGKGTVVWFSLPLTHA